jgi:hypothetical protein
MALGLLFAVALVYLLMVVNFQSWLDPFIIITRAAGRLRRHRLDAVRDTNDLQRAGADGWSRSPTSAWRRATVPTRPPSPPEPRACGRSSMTALAMLIGTLPMALGLGEGGEQNAGAVIGGLTAATFATLFFVPVVYSLMRLRPPREGFLTEAEAAGTSNA